MPALSTIAAIAGIGTAAYSLYKDITAKDPETPALPNVPQAPRDATPSFAASPSGYRRALRPGSPSGRASTLLTAIGPADTRAPTAAKTLLGQ